MNVAIVGGGLAGIVCALELEKYGIKPDLFERKDKIAEPYRHVGAALEIVLRPINDPLIYLREHYGVSLEPSGLVKKVIHNSPSLSVTITGRLGYFLNRGAGSASMDNRLAAGLKCRIFTNNEVDYKELKKYYDHVVVASGYPTEAIEMGLWKHIIKMSIKGTVIKGNFESDTFILWVNKDYCRSGYAYLAPFSSTEASLILAVDEVEPEDIDKYWERFIKYENLGYKIIESFKRVHYSGFMYPHSVGNSYFIGNASGCLDPLLGFGVFPTVVTACAAAKSIALGVAYEPQIKSVVELNMKLLEFRRMFNRLNNQGLDALIGSLGLPGVNSLIYNWKKINAVTLGYYALKPINTLLGRINKNPGN